MNTVYLVDDDPIILEYLMMKRSLFIECGFEICGAETNPLKALEEIRRSRPDVLFSDLKMPELSGIGLLKQLSSDRCKPLFVLISAYSDFADVLRYVPLPLARKSADDMMNRAKVDSAMYAYFAKMSEDNFYHPNSPYRNDDVFAAVLENIIAWDGASELSKLRPRAQLATLLRNRVGDPASDFSIPGEDRRLYDIRSEYTLLFFSEHGCPICGLLTEDLEASDLVQRYVKGGKLSIVYVYPEEMLPADRELYDLRARPSMYLLGRDKRVLLKDASRAAQIEGYFEQL